MKIIKSLNESIKKALSLTEEYNYNLSDENFNTLKTAVDNYIAKYPYHYDKETRAFEVYVDYKDELDKSTIKEIFESEKPLDAFYDIIGEWDWWQTADYEYDEIFNNLELDEDFKDEYRDNIREFLQDYIPYSIPYDHFNETIGVDIFLHDADSANREYYDMLVFEETDEQDEDGDYIKKLSEINGMLTKFLKMQGYTAEQFIDYFNEKKSGDTLLDSLIQEILDTNYGDGRGCQIAFLGSTTILELAKAMQDGGKITIPKSAMCGLVETFNGSGGALNIKLKQDVTGSLKEQGKASYQANGDFEIYYKDGYSYNIDDIYGLVASCWDSNITFDVAEKEEQNA